jgi:hypothetical protein
MQPHLFVPQCYNCKHFKNGCAAFPEGIPNDIMLNHFVHTQPYSDQDSRGVVYDPIKEIEIISAPTAATPVFERCFGTSWPPCQEPVYEDTHYCILHVEFPDESDPQYQTIRQKKSARVAERINARDFMFAGTKIYGIRATGIQDIKELNFNDAIVKGDVCFDYATVNGNAWFEKVILEGDGCFKRVTIKGSAHFEGATFYRRAKFTEAKIGVNADFKNAKLKELAGFGGINVGNYLEFQNKAEIEGPVNFILAKIGAGAVFNEITIKQDCYFEQVEIGENCSFEAADLRNDLRLSLLNVKGELSFRDASFVLPQVEERACRIAKQNCEVRGARQDADYYFYREMVARRRQRPWPVRYGEWLFIQSPTKYGTSPPRLFATWGLLGVIFGAALAYESGLGLNFLNGLAAIFAPGYALALTSGSDIVYKSITVIETILGAFFWGAFILVFSRRYMR